MNKKTRYLKKNLLIMLVLGGMLLVFFKGISICYDESKKDLSDGQGIETQQEKKRIQAEKLFMEGQKLLEKAKDENDIQSGLDMISQSISLFQEMNDMDGAGNAIRYLADFWNDKGAEVLSQGRPFDALDLFSKVLEFHVADERSISYYQSATSLATIRNLRQKSKAKRPMLALVDPGFDKLEEDFYFPRLQKMGLLAKRLNMIFDGKVDILQGPDATYSNLIKKPLPDYRFIVFGTHAVLEYQLKGILQPALLLAQTGNPEGQDGFLTMSEIMNLKLDADCCALIASETGLGKYIKGEGIISLGRAFQFAGGGSVLMSLWNVAEESSALLTERFFYHVKGGKSHREALRMARTDVRQKGYEHPFYWAAFVLMGE